MVKQSNKISTRWICETRDDFRAFLDETDFPDPVIAQGTDLTPIRERQLRERLKKIRHFPGDPATLIFQLFPELE